MNLRNYDPTDRWLALERTGRRPQIAQQYHGEVRLMSHHYSLNELRRAGFKVTLLRRVGRKPRRGENGSGARNRTDWTDRTDWTSTEGRDCGCD